MVKLSSCSARKSTGRSLRLANSSTSFLTAVSRYLVKRPLPVLVCEGRQSCWRSAVHTFATVEFLLWCFSVPVMLAQKNRVAVIVSHVRRMLSCSVDKETVRTVNFVPIWPQNTGLPVIEVEHIKKTSGVIGDLLLLLPFTISSFCLTTCRKIYTHCSGFCYLCSSLM